MRKILVAGFLISVVAWYWKSFNLMTSLVNSVSQAFSNIDVELKRRFDLIDNLIAAVKGYLQHEKDVLLKVTELRAKATQMKSATDVASIQQGTSDIIRNLVAVAEAYPTLKSDKHFLALSSELVETENRIAAARRTYNQAVTLYQTTRQIFPNSLISWAHQFGDKQLFDAEDAVSEAPKVTL